MRRDFTRWREQRRVAGYEHAARAAHDVPWAGDWWHSDGFTGGQLWLAPGRGWAERYTGCLGPGALETGELEVVSERELVLRGFAPDGGDERLVLLEYGGQPRLVERETLPYLFSGLLSEQEHGEAWAYLLGWKPGDEGLLPAGAGLEWDLGPAWTEHLAATPREARVLSETAPFQHVNSKGVPTAWKRAYLVDVGVDDGAWEGLLLHPPACGGARCLRVDRLADSTCEVDGYMAFGHTETDAPSLRDVVLSVACRR